MQTETNIPVRTWSLAAVVSFHCAWITLVFMSINAAVDVVSSDIATREILSSHLMHVLILSAAITTAVSVLIQREIGQPISRINAILYRLGAGDTDFPALNTRIEEVKSIEQGIRNMRERMFSGTSGEMMKRSVAALTDIRDVAKELQSLHPDETRRILDSVLVVAETLSVARYHADRNSSA